MLTGTGVIDYRAVVVELKRQRFNGYAQVECEHNMDDNLADVIESIRYFNGLSKSFSTGEVGEKISRAISLYIK